MSDKNAKVLPDLSKSPGANLRLTAKITDKGGLSIYGLQRFPVTLYREQWEALFMNSPKILAFIAANADKLAVRETKAAADGRVAL